MLSARNPTPVAGFSALMLDGATRHIPWPYAEGDEVPLDSLAPVARPTAVAAQRDTALCDWDEESLSTVKSRLQLSVAERLASASGEQVAELASRVQASVLECVAALDELHAALKREHRRRRQLEAEVSSVQEALVQARAELVGTQAGERRARHLALHDGLTALPNRGFFLGRLNHALTQVDPEYRQTLAVLHLDLDGFNRVNDTHGHDAGDEVLRAVAKRLIRAVRVEDMVSRLGGDEFACLLAELPPGREQLTRLACKLFDSLSAPFKIGKLRLTVRASIGIAMCSGDGMTAEGLLRNADTAMYHAKREQTGYKFFDPAQALPDGLRAASRR